MVPTRTMAPAMPISMTPPAVPASSPGDSRPSTSPPAMALRRQPSHCEADIPYRRATAETFTSGASASSTIRALVSSGQLRRATAGLFSIRLGTTSSNWKLLSLGICADIGTHTVIKTTVPIPHHMPSGQTGPPWRLRSARGFGAGGFEFFRFWLIEGLGYGDGSKGGRQPFVRTVTGGRIAPAQAIPDHKQNAAQHPAVIHPRHAMRKREIGLDP